MEVNGEKGPRDVAGEKEQRDVGSVGRRGGTKGHGNWRPMRRARGRW